MREYWLNLLTVKNVRIALPTNVAKIALYKRAAGGEERTAWRDPALVIVGHAVRCMWALGTPCYVLTRYTDLVLFGVSIIQDVDEAEAVS